MEPIWYLGPLGDLRPLVCPEKDVEITVERFGGVRQGLSGARSVDITGHRQKFDFNFRFLDDDEYEWLEALHFRMVPGPYRLLNPFKKNRLSPEASMVKSSVSSNQGVYLTRGNFIRGYDYPIAAGSILGQSSRWVGRSSTSISRYDSQKRSVNLPGETLVGSIYMKASATTALTMAIDYFDIHNNQLSGPTSVKSIGTSWTRYEVTGTAPAGAVTCRLAAYTSDTSNILDMAAAQLETGSVATAWEIGGGGPQVILDQLPTTSPRFSYRNATLNLLET